MKILQVNTHESGGGAEAIAYELHRGYKRAGHEAWIAVRGKRIDDATVVEIPNDARRSLWERTFLTLARRMPLRPARIVFGAASSPRRAWRTWRGEENFAHPGTRELLQLAGTPPDVLHLHNLHGDYFDLRQLPALTRSVPAILTMHDAWLTTGHCAHSFDCDRWLSGCGACPYLDTYPAVVRDATAANWQRKREIFRQSRMWITAPCQWLIDRAERSILAAAAIATRVVPYGIDLDTFSPQPRDAARAALELPGDAVVLMAAAFNLQTNVFKDYATLHDAIARIGDALPDRRVIFLAAGGSLQGRIGRVEIRARTFTGRAEMARAYAAADVFLHAARADTFPVVNLEALACGTPVVATAVSGIPEQIVHGVTGFLTPARDAAALADATLRVLQEPSLRAQMSAAARADAEARFHAPRMVGDYLRLIGEARQDRRDTIGAA